MEGSPWGGMGGPPGDELHPCPVCGAMFPAAEIEAHVDACLSGGAAPGGDDGGGAADAEEGGEVNAARARADGRGGGGCRHF